MSFYALVGMTPAARRQKVEEEYVNNFTESRLKAAEARVLALDAQVREAQADEDPYVRLYPLANELEDALLDYETCVERRADFVASR